MQHPILRIGPEAWSIVVSILKVSKENRLKYIHIVDRITGLLCKESPDCGCETTTYRTSHSI